MAIYLEERKTPEGRVVLYAEVSGQISGDDAKMVLERLKQMSSGDRKPHMLCMVASDTKYTAESQRIFTKDFNLYYDRIGAVVMGSIVRAAINFMIRVGGHSKTVRMFETKEEAMTWLDEGSNR